MKRLFLFGAMLVMALFANAQVGENTSDEKEHTVLAVRDGKMGCVSSLDSTKVLIPFEYEDFSCYACDWLSGCEWISDVMTRMVAADVNFYDIRDNLSLTFPLPVKKNGKWGLVDSLGKVLLPFEYDEIGDLSESDPSGIFIVVKNEKTGIFSDGRLVLQCLYDDVECVDLMFEYKDKAVSGCTPTSSMQGVYADLEKKVAKVLFKTTTGEKNQFFSANGVEVVLPEGITGIQKQFCITMLEKGDKTAILYNGRLSDFVYDAVIPWFYKSEEAVVFSQLFQVYANDYQTVLNADYKPIIPLSSDCDGYVVRIPQVTPHVQAVYKDAKTNKYGMVHETGKQILEGVYDEIEVFNAEKYQLKTLRNGKYSVVYYDGSPIVADCEEIENIGYDYLMIRQNGKYGLLDTNGRQILRCDYEELSYTDGELFKVSKNGNYGLVDKNGNTVLKCEYQSIEENEIEDEFISYTVCANGKYGVVDKNGKSVIKCEYDGINAFDGSLRYIIRKNGKYGMADTTGRVVMDCINDDISLFDIYPTVFKITNNGKSGLLDNNGKQILPCEYDELSDLVADTYKALKNGKFGAVDNTGATVLACEYDRIWVYNSDEGILQILKNGNYGLVDSKGNTLLRCEYQDGSYLRYFSITTQKTRYLKNGKWALVDENGKLLLPAEYEEIEIIDPENYLYIVRQNGKFGVADSTGTIKQKCIYDDIERLLSAESPEDNLLMPRLNGKYGLIDYTGTQFMPCKYDEIDNVDEAGTIYKIKQNGKYGVVDRHDRQILPCQYESIQSIFLSDNYFIRKNGKYGMVDSVGKTILPAEYEDMSYLDVHKGLYDVFKNGKCGLVDKNGKVILKCEYSEIVTFEEPMTDEEASAWLEFLGELAEAAEEPTAEAAEEPSEAVAEEPLEEVAIADTIAGNEELKSESVLKVKKNGRYGMVDTLGRQVLKCEYEEIVLLSSSDGIFKVRKNGRYGIADYTGKMLAPCTADSVEKDGPSCYQISIGGKTTKIDATGKPCEE